jgi:Beta-propeller repeat
MKKICFILFFLGQLITLKAQNVTISPGGITPALTGTYPRISYDAILALPSPVMGDMAYDITFKCLRVFTGIKWICTYQNPANYTPAITAIASAGGTSTENGFDIALDGSGNVYITGYYYGTATFGSTTLTSAGNAEIFVAKYSSAGALLWVQSAGGTSSDVGVSIALDATGNAYITGYFTGTATFGTNSVTSVGGSFDIFVAKYNSAGALQWVQSAGGTSTDVGSSIALDGTGNAYITGYYGGTATFGATSKTTAGGSDIFVAKYSSAGALQWVQSAGGTSTDIGNSLALDATGNAYITGNYSGTATFGATSITSAAGSQDIFVAKYDPLGVSWTWVQSAGGPIYEEGNSIALDASGNAYITGQYNGTATFGVTSITSAGFEDIFVAKYNSSGALQWVKSAGGGTSTEIGVSIALDATGNAYITGNYHGTATFGATSITSAGGLQDVFVAKYNSAGALQWVQSAGGTSLI